MKKPAIALASSGLVVAMAWAAHASGPASQAHTAGPEGGQAMNREERRIFKAASALDTRHNLVAATEEALQERGYAVGPIDGILDPTSYAALTGFQRDSGLAVTGRLDAQTFAALDVGLQMSPADPHPGAFTVGRTPPKGEYPPSTARNGSTGTETTTSLDVSEVYPSAMTNAARAGQTTAALTTDAPPKGEYPTATNRNASTRDASREAPPKGEYPPLMSSPAGYEGEYPPAPMRSNDRWLEQRLLVHLINHGIGPDVVVVADDWHVTLSGDVASEEARQRAAELARAFPGVTQVDNDLDVLHGATAASPETRMQPSTEGWRTGQPQANAGAQSLRPHPGGLIEPRWLIGQPVLDDANRRIGTVSHIWAEPTSGEIQELIVSSPGRDHRFIPWDDVDVVWDEQRPLLKVRRN